jgi:hypothetical protein
MSIVSLGQRVLTASFATRRSGVQIPAAPLRFSFYWLTKSLIDVRVEGLPHPRRVHMTLLMR